MEKSKKDITIIIPTFKRDVLLQQTIDSLANCDLIEKCEIFIVNDSKESEVCVDFPKKLDVSVFLNSGKGPGQARNFGASFSKSKYLLFLDDDMLLKNDTISKLLDHYKIHKGTCYSVNWTIPSYLEKSLQSTKFGRYLIEKGFTSLKGWLGEKSNLCEWNEPVVEIDSLAALFMFISRADFETAGGFDNEARFAFEDFLLSQKISKRGGSFKVITEVLAFHNEVDKMEPWAWLNRKMVGSQCRQELVAFGYKELALKYSLIKKFLFKIIYALRKPLLFTTSLIPIQFVYNWVFNLLLGAYLCRGYSKTIS